MRFALAYRTVALFSFFIRDLPLDLESAVWNPGFDQRVSAVHNRDG